MWCAQLYNISQMAWGGGGEEWGGEERGGGEEEEDEHKMWVLIFSTTFVWNIFHSKKNWQDMTTNVYWSSSTVPVILVKILMKLEFSP